MNFTLIYPSPNSTPAKVPFVQAAVENEEGCRKCYPCGNSEC